MLRADVRSLPRSSAPDRAVSKFPLVNRFAPLSGIRVDEHQVVQIDFSRAAEIEIGARRVGGNVAVWVKYTHCATG